MGDIFSLFFNVRGFETSTIDLCKLLDMWQDLFFNFLLWNVSTGSVLNYQIPLAATGFMDRIMFLEV